MKYISFDELMKSVEKRSEGLFEANRQEIFKTYFYNYGFRSLTDDNMVLEDDAKRFVNMICGFDQNLTIPEIAKEFNWQFLQRRPKWLVSIGHNDKEIFIYHKWPVPEKEKKDIEDYCEDVSIVWKRMKPLVIDISSCK